LCGLERRFSHASRFANDVRRGIRRGKTEGPKRLNGGRSSRFTPLNRKGEAASQTKERDVRRCVCVCVLVLEGFSRQRVFRDSGSGVCHPGRRRESDPAAEGEKRRRQDVVKHTHSQSHLTQPHFMGNASSALFSLFWRASRTVFSRAPSHSGHSFHFAC
jgi:hypothetical protein